MFEVIDAKSSIVFCCWGGGANSRIITMRNITISFNMLLLTTQYHESDVCVGNHTNLFTFCFRDFGRFLIPMAV